MNLSEPDKTTDIQLVTKPEIQPSKRLISFQLIIFILLSAVLATGSVTLIITAKKDNSSTKNQNLSSNVNQYDTEDHNQTEGEDLHESEQPIVSKPTDIDYTKLPLGDDRYSTTPKKGYVYSCRTTYNGGGAFTQGPWIDSTNKTWDLTKKVHVDGQVSWPNASFSTSTISGQRVLATNALPTNHTTGTYPVNSSDDAYNYDRNPNTIRAQSKIVLTLPLNPTVNENPSCVGGEVGIMLSGVPLYNAFDAGGRDAVATEIQDSCGGHPQQAGVYHYHGNSDCIEPVKTTSSHSELLGYSFDGFGIYGKYGENGLELSSSDLDECHGHTHTVNWDGVQKEIYHYHLTQDFPYSISCYRGTANSYPTASNETGTSQNSQPPPRR